MYMYYRTVFYLHMQQKYYDEHNDDDNKKLVINILK
jgi:hypothetical protein